MEPRVSRLPLFLLDAPVEEAPAGFDGLVPPRAGESEMLRVPERPTAAGFRIPVLNAAAALELLDLGFTGFVFTPEARPEDLLALPAWALAAGDVCAFGRVPLAEIRHDLGDHLPPGPGPHRLAAREGELVAVRDGASTTLYAGEYFSMLKCLPDLHAAGARRFRFLFPLVEAAERGVIARLAAAAPALRTALAAGDRPAWDAAVAAFLAGCGVRVLERSGRLE